MVHIPAELDTELCEKLEYAQTLTSGLDAQTSVLDAQVQDQVAHGVNPVLVTSEWAYKETNLVQIDDEGVRAAAAYIHKRMRATKYTPRTWHTHPLHPPESSFAYSSEPSVYAPEPTASPLHSPSSSSSSSSSSTPPPGPSTHPLHPLEPSHTVSPDPSLHTGCPNDTRTTLDWLFLVSALNFSFWSALPEDTRYGVEWWADGWGVDSINGVESCEEGGGEGNGKGEGKGNKGGKTKTKVWTGYWSLLAAINRALEEGIPITTPSFYASPTRCPDALLAHVFRAAPGCVEGMPMWRERVGVMRAVGGVLCSTYGGSFHNFITAFQKQRGGRGTALELVHAVREAFEAFRDEVWWAGRRVYLWKRAQILVAETWAAFYPPPSPSNPKDLKPKNARHPIFPQTAQIAALTMFADYRVPQVLHHLRILVYPRGLVRVLRAGSLHEHEHHGGEMVGSGSDEMSEEVVSEKVSKEGGKEGKEMNGKAGAVESKEVREEAGMLAPGSREELSIRCASVVAVERVRVAICALRRAERAASNRANGRDFHGGGEEDVILANGTGGVANGTGGVVAENGAGQENGEEGDEDEDDVSSVLVDFYLWDLAKRVESGEECVEGLATNEVVPAHRTRSIWY
ncbi:hypothetical protein PLICRDRAFT_39203 [Plicaturopsis crispa FD-325 SS-3]|nr:hypothetical protein PLICRDRAFT_39203 [Plicaturopsis crispa FD-325 SS-3]